MELMKPGQNGNLGLLLVVASGFLASGQLRAEDVDCISILSRVNYNEFNSELSSKDLAHLYSNDISLSEAQDGSANAWNVGVEADGYGVDFGQDSSANSRRVAFLKHQKNSLALSEKYMSTRRKQVDDGVLKLVENCLKRNPFGLAVSVFQSSKLPNVFSIRMNYVPREGGPLAVEDLRFDAVGDTFKCKPEIPTRLGHETKNFLCERACVGGMVLTLNSKPASESVPATGWQFGTCQTPPAESTCSLTVTTTTGEHGSTHDLLSVIVDGDTSSRDVQLEGALINGGAQRGIAAETSCLGWAKTAVLRVSEGWADPKGDGRCQRAKRRNPPPDDVAACNANKRKWNTLDAIDVKTLRITETAISVTNGQKNTSSISYCAREERTVPGLNRHATSPSQVQVQLSVCD